MAVKNTYVDKIESPVERWLEVVDDGLSSPRTTAWEDNFLQSIKRGLNTYGDAFEMSDKQREVLLKIERKIYAAG